MGRFERFMEAWGLLTLDLTRSSSRWRRWCGILLGAMAVWTMVPLMGIWWCQRALRQAGRRLRRWITGGG